MKRVPCVLHADRRSIPLVLALLDDPAQRSQGYRGRLPPQDDHEGLLFLWPEVTRSRFDMRGVPFDLELVVGSPDGRVTGCCRMPGNSTSLFCPVDPFRFAVELKAGWASRNGVPSRLELA